MFDCWFVLHPQVAFSRCAGTAAATRWARPTARAPSSYSTSESEREEPLQLPGRKAAARRRKKDAPAYRNLIVRTDEMSQVLRFLGCCTADSQTDDDDRGRFFKNAAVKQMSLLVLKTGPNEQVSVLTGSFV